MMTPHRSLAAQLGHTITFLLTISTVINAIHNEFSSPTASPKRFVQPEHAGSHSHASLLKQADPHKDAVINDNNKSGRDRRKRFMDSYLMAGLGKPFLDPNSHGASQKRMLMTMGDPYLMSSQNWQNANFNLPRNQNNQPNPVHQKRMFMDSYVISQITPEYHTKRWRKRTNQAPQPHQAADDTKNDFVKAAPEIDGIKRHFGVMGPGMSAKLERHYGGEYDLGGPSIRRKKMFDQYMMSSAKTQPWERAANGADWPGASNDKRKRKRFFVSPEAAQALIE